MDKKEKINMHFLELLEDSDYAIAHFNAQLITNRFKQFNGEKLKQLQGAFERAKEEYERENVKQKKMKLLLFIAEKILNITLINNDTDLRMRNALRNYLQAETDLEIFEADVAYLMIKEIIDIKKTEKLGFSHEYIIKLLEKYKKQVKYCGAEYYSDERMNKRFEITAEGELQSLFNTPLGDYIFKLSKPKLTSNR